MLVRCRVLTHSRVLQSGTMGAQVGQLGNIQMQNDNDKSPCGCLPNFTVDVYARRPHRTDLGNMFCTRRCSGWCTDLGYGGTREGGMARLVKIWKEEDYWQRFLDRYGNFKSYKVRFEGGVCARASLSDIMRVKPEHEEGVGWG